MNGPQRPSEGCAIKQSRCQGAAAGRSFAGLRRIAATQAAGPGRLTTSETAPMPLDNAARMLVADGLVWLPGPCTGGPLTASPHGERRDQRRGLSDEEQWGCHEGELGLPGTS